MSKACDKLAEKLKAEIAGGSAAAATGMFRQGLADDQAGFCAALRKQGVLRCSAYDYETRILKSLVGDALKAQTATTALTPETRGYFASVKALLMLGATCKTVYRDSLRGINTRSLKSYIASVDHLFWYPPTELHASSLAISQDGYAIEEVASALSTHIFELGQRRDLSTVAINVLHENKVESGFYLDKLREVAALRRFREAEVLIDSFSYTATVNGNEVRISAPSPTFEKALRLGYIHSTHQMLSDAGNIKLQVKSVSMEDFCRGLYERVGDKMVFCRLEPVERIVVGLPDVPEMRAIIEGDTYFSEEIIQVSLLQKELLLKPDQVTGTSIAPGLTILDVLKFQRLFRILFWAFKQYVADHQLERSALLYRSMVPVYAGSKLREFLTHFFSPEKSQAYIDAFTWAQTGNTIFDIQTQPLVCCGDNYLVPIGVLAESNLVRNHMMRTHFRFDSESEEDPVGDELETVLAKVGAEVKRNVSFSYGDEDGDVDFLAVIGTHLFACECKDSLHPCSPFELRTSYDYLLKGSRQIRLFAKAFADSAFRGDLAARCALPLTSATQLHSCIVTGNRMFSGWIEAAVPVRPLYEMCNVVENGKMKVRASRGRDREVEVMTLKLWREECFDPLDLVAYIEKNSLHEPRFNAMKPWAETTCIREKALTLETYLMDPAEEVRQLAGAFPHGFSRERNPFAIGIEAAVEGQQGQEVVTAKAAEAEDGDRKGI